MKLKKTPRAWLYLLAVVAIGPVAGASGLDIPVLSVPSVTAVSLWANESEILAFGVK